MKTPRPGVAMTGMGALMVTAVVVAGHSTASARSSAASSAASSGAASVPTSPVTDSVLVCPTVGSADAGSTSVVSASSTGTSGTIELRSMAVSAAAAPLARLALSASVVSYSAPAGTKPGPVLVHATGARAAGLTARVTTRVPSGVRRSLRSAPCSAPSGDTWLVGGSAAAGRRDIVYLTNADQASAVADVTVYGAGGPLQPPPSQGVTIPPHAQVALALDALTPGLLSAAVHVHARSGRVAAALLDAAAVGGTAAGVDWVPPSVQPARSVTVTGIPGDASGRHTLLLLAPGQDDATVRVRFATSEGLLSPEPVNSLDVPAGQLQTINLDKLAGVAPPYALVVDSDHPVVAGVQTAEGGKSKLTEFSWAGGSPDVLGSAVSVPWVYRSASVSTAVQVTAVGSDVVVRLTTRSPAGQDLDVKTYTVPSGRTLQVVPSSVSLGAGSALVEAPAGSRVVVGSYTIEYGAHGPLIAGGPLLQTPLTVLEPPAVADPSVGLPGH